MLGEKVACSAELAPVKLSKPVSRQQVDARGVATPCGCKDKDCMAHMDATINFGPFWTCRRRRPSHTVVLPVLVAVLPWPSGASHL